MNITEINQKLRTQSPQEIVTWALENAKKPVITTNFRPYEAAILHACTRVENDLKVIWCDTGYNTSYTYLHAEELISKLKLNIQLYVPRQSAAHRNVVLGIPGLEDPKHSLFSEQVKLEPFRRAMEEHQPDVWFTNLRKGQTALRDTLDILSVSADGVLKVSPFYHWSDQELNNYLEIHDLPNEERYYDPTKLLSNRECGIHK
ncbi:phosphoadenosine phosphosulfate reductase family protein [Lishizhenia sp.]|uniref:phosphoadenosine phosphosulfate reductase domain-containing protein n=1 Tax=Lishizhenia sp. TaxID=2497594 RepID=UPI00299DC2FC|nr:phosphoadenosine phosphosulfate reductase family protein [Lishizhenia sp.]MDX1446348.1 phosphoadenosine phosphosulfate reductase family protein [Lishizhenia sp.]